MVRLMKRIVVVATLAFCVLAPGAAFAFGAATGTIEKLRVFVDGRVFVTLDRPLEGTPPECSAGKREMVTFDSTTAGGKSMLSTLLAAHLAGKSVYLRGDGICTIYSDIEDLNYASTPSL